MVTLRAGPRRQAPDPGLPDVPIPGNIFAGESAALIRIGENIRRSGGQLVNMARRKDYIDEIDQFERGQIEYGTFLNDQEKARIIDPHHSTKSDNFSKARTGKEEEILTKYPKGRTRLEKYFSAKGDEEELRVFANARKAMIRDIDQRMPARRIAYAKSWHNSQPQNRDDIESKWNKQYKDHVSEGVKTQEWVDLQRSLDAFEMGKEAIERDPELAQKMLAEGGDTSVLISDDALKHLTPEKARELRRLAASRIDFLSVEKTNADRIAKAELEARQYQNQKDSYLKIREGQPVDLDNMLENDEITLPAHKSLLKLMSDGPTDKDDPRALYEANRAIEDVRSGDMQEKDALELIISLGPKLEEQTISSLIPKLTTAGREDDPVTRTAIKTYLEFYEGSLKDGDIDELTYNNMHKEMVDFAEKYPEATNKEIDDKHQEIAFPVVANWFDKIMEGITSTYTAGLSPYMPKEKIDKKKKERAGLLFNEVIYNPTTGEYMGRNNKEEQWQTVR